MLASKSVLLAGGRAARTLMAAETSNDDPLGSCGDLSAEAARVQAEEAAARCDPQCSWVADGVHGQ
eukprot:3850264-Prymnesium_polylepis.1